MMGETMTNFLTSNSSFVDGVATITGFSGSFYKYNTSKSPEIADQEAIRRDWAIVGQDLRKAYAKEKANSTQ
jgi:hypothetical protein